MEVAMEAARRIIKIKKGKIKASLKQGTEAPDTLQCPQRPVVTATIDMGQKVGIVWPLSPVHGSTSVHLEPEGQAGLERTTRQSVK